MATRGRQAFQPTDEQRKNVEVMVGLGITQKIPVWSAIGDFGHRASLPSGSLAGYSVILVAGGLAIREVGLRDPDRDNVGVRAIEVRSETIPGPPHFREAAFKMPSISPSKTTGARSPACKRPNCGRSRRSGAIAPATRCSAFIYQAVRWTAPTSAA
jgi:hypothetical protein